MIPERVNGLGGNACLLRFIFELVHNAVGRRDILPLTEIDGLVDAAAFPERVEVANLTDLSGCRDPMVRVGW